MDTIDRWASHLLYQKSVKRNFFYLKNHQRFFGYIVGKHQEELKKDRNYHKNRINSRSIVGTIGDRQCSVPSICAIVDFTEKPMLEKKKPNENEKVKRTNSRRCR